MTEELFEYGIYTEVSDIRAHVSAVNKTIYVFPTRNGRAAIERHAPIIRPAYQEGVNSPTATGWLVKIEWIDDLRRVKFYSWPGWDKLTEGLSTSQKGGLAVECVIETIRRGRFPFWLDASEDERQNIQLEGTDILVFCKKRIQVKCDYRGGDAPAGTGNLFLQKNERNPLKKH